MPHTAEVPVASVVPARLLGVEPPAQATPPPVFRSALGELGRLLIYEVGPHARRALSPVVLLSHT